MQAGPRSYQFGRFRVDAVERLLVYDSKEVPLTQKAFDVLLALVEQSGHIVGKDELIRRVWPNQFVDEGNLTQNIYTLRKTLGEMEAGVQYIETVSRRGYRFSPQVQVERDGPSEKNMTALDAVIDERTRQDAAHAQQTYSQEPSTHPRTNYARNGDVNIAYQIIGHGPLDVVFVMGWVSHLEYFWKEKSFSAFLRRLASFSRLIVFDKRGTGLSDRVPLNELPTLEQRMDDVRCVMEAAGSEHAALIGVSEGGPMSALFAATYPERTAALVMIGTYAKRIRAHDYPWAPTAEQREHFFEEIRQHWGGPVGLEERAPSKVDDPLFREWWAEYLRMGASPGAAVALTKMNAEVDVRNVLPTVRVPTLVLHRSGDRCLKVEEGRYVAQLIPNAKYVEMPGADHLPFVGDQDAILDEIEEFLTGVRHNSEPERVLATILFVRTKVRPPGVDAIDDAEWQNTVKRFKAQVRLEITRCRGREIDLTGYGPLAAFDGPARAVRCACSISEHATRLGIEIRSGLHTGECDLLDVYRVGGLAVEIGRKISERAEAGEVLVSHTVKDLVAGSGLRFEDRGTETFEDIPGIWHLYKVAQ